MGHCLSKVESQRRCRILQNWDQDGFCVAEVEWVQDMYPAEGTRERNDMLMGGGGSFSARGPGKGMYSRLYLPVLNEFPQMQSFSAFSTVYNSTGLFGIQGTTTDKYVRLPVLLVITFDNPVDGTKLCIQSADFATKAVDVAVRELIAVATPGEVDQVQLDRAKQSTKSAILMNLESRMVASEDIG